MEQPDVLPLLAPELLVATCTHAGERLHANDAWATIFGGGALWGRLGREDQRFAQEYLREAAQGGLVVNQVFLVERHGRDLAVPVLLNFLPVRLPETPAGRYPVVLTGEVLQEPQSWTQDQTKRRRMEMLGQMAMGIAHDFNNLLTSVLGHVELMKAEVEGTAAPDPAGLLDGLRTIERAAGDGAALVRKIQSYIRHEKRTRFEPLDLRAVVDEVVQLTRPYWHNEPRRQGVNIDVETDLADVPEVEGDEAELREVLVNLTLNAVQAMRGGGTIAFRTRCDDGREVTVEIEDTGTGMPEAVRRRIFEPLFTTKGAEGTGMGLAVSYGIVQEHDGRIDVWSEVGRGTRFSLRFPARAVREAPVSTPPAVSAPALAAAPLAATSTAGGLRVLVVDDEDMVRNVTARLLRLRGHMVDDVPSGAAALARVAEQPYDAVVTDLGMPEMSGAELAYRLKQHHPRLPIVLLTGHTDVEGQTEHVDAVLKKPFKIDALDAALRDVVPAA